MFYSYIGFIIIFMSYVLHLYLIKYCIFLLQDCSNFNLTLEDGTEVDEDYFQCINNEALKLSTRDPEDSLIWRLGEFLGKCIDLEPNLSSQLNEVLSRGSLQQVLQILMTIGDDKTQLSSQAEHPHWFEGRIQFFSFN